MKTIAQSELYSAKNRDRLMGRPRQELMSIPPYEKGLVIVRYILMILLLTFLMSVLSGTTQDASAATIYVTEDETISSVRMVSSNDTIRILPRVTLTITKTGTLHVLGAVQNLGTIQNHGSIIIDGSGAIDNGAMIVNTNTISNKSGYVGITNLSGAILNNSSGTIVNHSTLINQSGGAINNENVGTIENHNGGTIENQGNINNYFSDIENHEGGTIQNYGIIDSEFGADITNEGTIANYDDAAIKNVNIFTVVDSDDTD